MGKTFGEEIRELREAKGLSQGDLATMLGITQGALSHYEKGRRTGHDANLVNRLCEALGVSLDHFAKFISPDVRVPPPPVHLIPTKPSTVMLPYLGEIPCGRPELRLEDADEEISIPETLAGPGRFVVRAKGMSMVNAGIVDGDYLVILKQDTADHGQIVLASVNGEVTLKRYEVRERKRRGSVVEIEKWLFPASELHKPILLKPDDHNRIIGLLKGRFGVV